MFLALELYELLNVFNMPGGHIRTFFDMLVVNLKYHEQYSPFKENMAELTSNPYYELDSF